MEVAVVVEGVKVATVVVVAVAVVVYNGSKTSSGTAGSYVSSSTAYYRL